MSKYGGGSECSVLSPDTNSERRTKHATLHSPSSLARIPLRQWFLQCVRCISRGSISNAVYMGLQCRSSADVAKLSRQQKCSALWFHFVSELRKLKRFDVGKVEFWVVSHATNICSVSYLEKTLAIQISIRSYKSLSHQPVKSWNPRSRVKFPIS